MVDCAECRPALPPVLTTPSLLEIQLEQEKQLAEERSEQEQHAKVSLHYHLLWLIFMCLQIT